MEDSIPYYHSLVPDMLFSMGTRNSNITNSTVVGRFPDKDFIKMYG